MDKQTTVPSPDEPGPLVLFDGSCGMCNRIVQWLLDHDRANVLHYAPLQSEWVQEHLRQRKVEPDLDSMVFILGEKTYVRSEAVRQVALKLPGWPSWVGRAAGLVPPVFRDPFYRLVAMSRRMMSRMMGMDSCRLVSSEQRQRIHDGPIAPGWLQSPGTPHETAAT